MHPCRLCEDSCQCFGGWYDCISCECCRRYNEEGDDPEAEGDLWEPDCGMDRNGNCGKAGSEDCDFECPYSHAVKN